jgi:hypothetical protein
MPGSDRTLLRLRQACRGLPEVHETTTFGNPTWQGEGEQEGAEGDASEGWEAGAAEGVRQVEIRPAKQNHPTRNDRMRQPPAPCQGSAMWSHPWLGQTEPPWSGWKSSVA